MLHIFLERRATLHRLHTKHRREVVLTIEFHKPCLTGKAKATTDSHCTQQTCACARSSPVHIPSHTQFVFVVTKKAHTNAITILGHCRANIQISTLEECSFRSPVARRGSKHQVHNSRQPEFELSPKVGQHFPGSPVDDDPPDAGANAWPAQCAGVQTVGQQLFAGNI